MTGKSSSPIVVLDLSASGPPVRWTYARRAWSLRRIAAIQAGVFWDGAGTFGHWPGGGQWPLLIPPDFFRHLSESECADGRKIQRRLRRRSKAR